MSGSTVDTDLRHRRRVTSHRYFRDGRPTPNRSTRGDKRCVLNRKKCKKAWRRSYDYQPLVIVSGTLIYQQRNEKYTNVVPE